MFRYRAQSESKGFKRFHSLLQEFVRESVVLEGLSVEEAASQLLGDDAAAGGNLEERRGECLSSLLFFLFPLL